MNNTAFESIISTHGKLLSYEYLPGKQPTVVFLGGYASDMTGTKGEWLRSFCEKNGRAYLRLDYSGHGQSEGEFEFGTIGEWMSDALDVITMAVSGPMILVGSSMGGWIMLLVARQLKERVAGLVGIAAAPDFTENLMWNDFDQTTRDRLIQHGVIRLPSEYDEQGLPLRFQFIEDGRRHLLLREPLALDCPVRLIHGMRDADVPWQTADRIMGQLSSEDVRIHYIKDGDHRLSDALNLAFLGSVLRDLLEQLAP